MKILQIIYYLFSKLKKIMKLSQKTEGSAGPLLMH